MGVFRILLVLAVVFPQSIALAGHAKPEKWYQEKWCSGRGRMEVVMPDKTWCDCLTRHNAVEFDFGKKWAEAIGQSLHYARHTGRRAGIVLKSSAKRTGDIGAD